MSDVEASPRPWSIVVDDLGNGDTVKIVDARGGVICLMKAAGGRKMANAIALTRAVNSGGKA